MAEPQRCMSSEIAVVKLAEGKSAPKAAQNLRVPLAIPLSNGRTLQVHRCHQFLPRSSTDCFSSSKRDPAHSLQRENFKEPSGSSKLSFSANRTEASRDDTLFTHDIVTQESHLSVRKQSENIARYAQASANQTESKLFNSGHSKQEWSVGRPVKNLAREIQTELIVVELQNHSLNQQKDKQSHNQSSNNKNKTVSDFSIPKNTVKLENRHNKFDENQENKNSNNLSLSKGVQPSSVTENNNLSLSKGVQPSSVTENNNLSLSKGIITQPLQNLPSKIAICHLIDLSNSLQIHAPISNQVSLFGFYSANQSECHSRLIEPKCAEISSMSTMPSHIITNFSRLHVNYQSTIRHEERPAHQQLLSERVYCSQKVTQTEQSLLVNSVHVPRLSAIALKRPPVAIPCYNSAYPNKKPLMLHRITKVNSSSSRILSIQEVNKSMVMDGNNISEFGDMMTWNQYCPTESENRLTQAKVSQQQLFNCNKVMASPQPVSHRNALKDSQCNKSKGISLFSTSRRKQHSNIEIQQNQTTPNQRLNAQWRTPNQHKTHSRLMSHSLLLADPNGKSSIAFGRQSVGAANQQQHRKVNNEQIEIYGHFSQDKKVDRFQMTRSRRQTCQVLCEDAVQSSCFNLVCGNGQQIIQSNSSFATPRKEKTQNSRNERQLTSGIKLVSPCRVTVDQE